MARLAPDYPALAAETMAALRAALAACAADPPVPGAGAGLFRAAHTLKGEGTSFGYPLVTDIAARLCAALEGGAARDPAARPLLAAHVTAIEAVLAARLTGGGGPVGARLLATLDGMAAARGG